MDKAALLSTSARETAILEHLPQVKLIARRTRERLPGSVCLDDLISAGVIGLISAIDRYDSSQGVKLKTYAEFKIRGAILDALRSLDFRRTLAAEDHRARRPRTLPCRRNREHAASRKNGRKPLLLPGTHSARDRQNRRSA